jgi:hypothetical protein
MFGASTIQAARVGSTITDGHCIRCIDAGALSWKKTEAQLRSRSMGEYYDGEVSTISTVGLTM